MSEPPVEGVEILPPNSDREVNHNRVRRHAILRLVRFFIETASAAAPEDSLMVVRGIVVRGSC